MTKTVVEWGKEIGINPDTINARLRAGCTAADALRRSKHKWNKHTKTKGQAKQPQPKPQPKPQSTSITAESKLVAIKALMAVPMNDGDKLAAISLVLEA